MIRSFRNFAKTKFAGILVFIMIIPFVFWGMGGMFSSGNTNTIAKINKESISTQEFIDHLNNSGIPEKTIKDNLNNNIIVGCSVAGVQVENSTLIGSGDSIQSAFSGLLFENAVVATSNWELGNHVQYGILGRTSTDVTLDSIYVWTDPELSAQNQAGDEEAGIEERLGSLGIVTVDSNISITGTEKKSNMTVN